MKCVPSDLWYLTYFLFFPNINSEKYKNTRYAKIFEENSIVPHLLPTNPEEICNVIYEPNLIIATGQPYYMYQVNNIPQIIWEFSFEKYYTVVMFGTIRNEIRHPYTTAPVLSNNTNDNPKLPEKLWHHWVLVDVRKNDLSSGSLIQPFAVNWNLQPNETHKIVYAFAVFEQAKKFNLQVDVEENTSKKLLERYFNPLSKYVENFKDSILIAGNFFYGVFKPEGLILDSSPVRLKDFKW